MRLRLAANPARDRGVEPLGEDLDGTIVMLNQALRELRELAHGIHPSLLSSGGLALAVPELAGRCPVPVEIDVQAEGRLPEVIESTAYFVVAEALANVAKHSEATRAWVRAASSTASSGSWCATTAWAARIPTGTGMLGIADRVDAVGGTARARQPAGGGHDGHRAHPARRADRGRARLATASRRPVDAAERVRAASGRREVDAVAVVVAVGRSGVPSAS